MILMKSPISITLSNTTYSHMLKKNNVYETKWEDFGLVALKKKCNKRS